MSQNDSDKSDVNPKEISAAAERALKEAEERRQKEEPQSSSQPTEIGGPKGRDPIRFGDWEKDGIVSDF